MKVIGAKTTFKTSATSDVGHFTKSLKKMKMTFWQFSVSKCVAMNLMMMMMMRYCWIEKGWNRIAMYLERLRT